MERVSEQEFLVKEKEWLDRTTLVKLVEFAFDEGTLTPGRLASLLLDYQDMLSRKLDLPNLARLGIGLHDFARERFTNRLLDKFLKEARDEGYILDEEGPNVL
ncbi:hypothetical protein UFOVP67_63 [uncultured Caudovirales phage]|uniref:Uncharacterized protein n=1 Tax=uncultured Caudovirales phage TaxID=2100421 RepID=A0A6J5TBU2_9CAUD|nr:hypothetical protein UFOVP67_63 [uncultured Caudovirales phage]